MLERAVNHHYYRPDSKAGVAASVLILETIMVFSGLFKEHSKHLSRYSIKLNSLYPLSSLCQTAHCPSLASI